MKHGRNLLGAAAAVALLATSFAISPAANASYGGGNRSVVRKHQCVVFICNEVASRYKKETFGKKIVGHDEPSLLFYSHRNGSGNRQQYTFKLPTDPPPTHKKGRTFTFELTPAFWFGEAICADQSAPNPGLPCTADSDSNLTSSFKTDPGQAFMEMQFYPPGWVPFEQGGISCSATQWCAALNIDSLAENYTQGSVLDSSCANYVGIEYVNFAFITKNGKAQAPANPINATNATYTPDKSKDLFMSPGDTIKLRMHDTASGLRIEINDLTSGKSGLMTASASNGFAQVKYNTDPSVACTPLPYNFHPEFATSTPQTRVLWAAHSYNVAFDEETGHFDYCQDDGGAIDPGQDCPTAEGENGLSVPDNDDYSCYPRSSSLLVKVSGCVAANYGFDGTSYLPDWPDGNTKLHPTSIYFTSATTGGAYKKQYGKLGFEVDSPAIEGPYCNYSNGKGCPRVPYTDYGKPAKFYPFFSSGTIGGHCVWGLGNDIKGFTQNDFGKIKQYAKPLQLSYPDIGGRAFKAYEDYRGITSNPCPSSSSGTSIGGKR